MINYNCYIVDDEPDSIEILRDYIEQTPGLRLEYSTTNPRNIISVIRQNPLPRIAFLDIEMPGISGLELAGLINADTAIIFITSYTQHAAEAFETDAHDYLVKPVSYKRFLKAVMKVQARLENNIPVKPIGDDYFYVKGNHKGEFIKICFTELLFVKSLENYVTLYTAKGSHITYLTLKEMEAKLSQPNFLKVHKSHLVNLDRIAGLTGNELTMENKMRVAVGTTYREVLLDRLKEKIFTTDRRRAAGE